MIALNYWLALAMLFAVTTSEIRADEGLVDNSYQTSPLSQAPLLKTVRNVKCCIRVTGYCNFSGYGSDCFDACASAERQCIAAGYDRSCYRHSACPIY